MIKELEYPFIADEIIIKKKAYKRKLLEADNASFIDKHIAILGGETTKNIRLVLELFLLNYGIRPSFYESEYNLYYEDGMFPNAELEEFKPDIVYICTCIHNIDEFPSITDSRSDAENKKREVTEKFSGLWDSLRDRYNCPIIQNNFEYPRFRLMGNKDASDYRGRVNFITGINLAFYDYSQTHDNFYICDVNYISASYGLEKWSDPSCWHMYKYAVSIPAIPYLSFNVANIIKSIFGRNKKAFNLDLDNTLWGGIVGEDGADNIEIGQETAISQTFSEFQEYLKLHKNLGIALTINSKNDQANALQGLNRPDSVLKQDDFANIQANWNPKCENLSITADEMGLTVDSFVFIDDNPAERDIIRKQCTGTAVPELQSPESYISIIDKSGFFETTTLSEEDVSRVRMYQENAKRNNAKKSFQDYGEYLNSLEMKAEIKPFASEYMGRIAQLTNKSNQFNLTTKRYTLSEIETIADDEDYLTLYGRLRDKFGDNGVVSLIVGEKRGKGKSELHIELWLMSCRVLKRDMEFAMMDCLVSLCKANGIKTIYGYYFPTTKNSMVKDFYARQGFEKISEDENGNTRWFYDLGKEYINKQSVIEIAD